jgi:hypothetical protein
MWLGQVDGKIHSVLTSLGRCESCSKALVSSVTESKETKETKHRLDTEAMFRAQHQTCAKLGNTQCRRHKIEALLGVWDDASGLSFEVVRRDDMTDDQILAVFAKTFPILVPAVHVLANLLALQSCHAAVHLEQFVLPTSAAAATTETKIAKTLRIVPVRSSPPPPKDTETKESRLPFAPSLHRSLSDGSGSGSGSGKSGLKSPKSAFAEPECAHEWEYRTRYRSMFGDDFVEHFDECRKCLERKYLTNAQVISRYISSSEPMFMREVMSSVVDDPKRE